ncbi:MAG: hypothetical protein ACLQGP_23255 [Isosphaeraceae bacterium]
MLDLPVLKAFFGALHFGEARIGHVGRTRRLVRAADAIIQHPGGTLTQKFHELAPLDAFYRLANRPEITHRAVLDPHRRRTLCLIGASTDPILLIHDTTELDYTSITSLASLGQIGDGHGRGYECHNTLTVQPRPAPSSAWPGRSSNAATMPPRARPGGSAAIARVARAGSGGGGARRSAQPPPAPPGSMSAIGAPISSNTSNLSIKSGILSSCARSTAASAGPPTARASGAAASCARTRRLEPLGARSAHVVSAGPGERLREEEGTMNEERLPILRAEGRSGEPSSAAAAWVLAEGRW